MHVKHGLLTKFDPFSVWLVTDKDIEAANDLPGVGNDITFFVYRIAAVTAVLTAAVTLIAMAFIKLF